MLRISQMYFADCSFLMKKNTLIFKGLSDKIGTLYARVPVDVMELISTHHTALKKMLSK